MDADKAERLRAAREKLKKFQDKQNRSVPDQCNAESLSSQSVNLNNSDVSETTASGLSHSEPHILEAETTCHSTPEPHRPAHVGQVAKQDSRMSFVECSQCLSTTAEWAAKLEETELRYEAEVKALESRIVQLTTESSRVVSLQQQVLHAQAELDGLRNQMVTSSTVADGKIERLNSDLEALRAKSLHDTETYEQNLASKDQEIVMLHAKNHSIEESLSRFQSDHVALDEALELSKRSIVEYRQSLERIEAERSLSDSAATEWRNKYQQCLQAKAASDAKQQELMIQISQLQSSTSDNNDQSDIVAELQSTGQENENLRLKLDNFKRRDDELTAYIQHAAKDREQIIEQYNEYGQQLTAQIEHLTHDLDDKSDEIDRLQAEIASLSRTVIDEVAVNSASALETTVEEFRSRISQLTSENDELRSHAAQLGSESQPGNEQNVDTTSLLAELESLRVSASRSATQNADLKSSVIELEAALAKATDEQASLHIQVETLVSQIQQAEERNRELISSRDAAQALLGERDSMIKRLREENGLFKSSAASQLSLASMTSCGDQRTETEWADVSEKLAKSEAKSAALQHQNDRLEHIIICLQEETDTVGDYVTMYQYKRREMKSALAAKDRELASFARRLHYRNRIEAQLIQLARKHTYDDQSEDGAKLSELLQLVNELDDVTSESAVSPRTDHAPSSPDRTKPDVGSPNKPTEGQDLCDLSDFHPWFWTSTDRPLMAV